VKKSQQPMALRGDTEALAEFSHGLGGERALLERPEWVVYNGGWERAPSARSGRKIWRGDRFHTGHEPCMLDRKLTLSREWRL
jgi:hypothetical protein